MKRHPQENDIRIGKDEWIKFGDLAGGQARAVQIDPHLAPVMPFIESLETECQADCCGISAFVLWPEEIKKALVKYGPRELEVLSSDLASVQSKIEELPSDTVVSWRMNQFFPKVVFVEILAHVRKVVKSLR